MTAADPTPPAATATKGGARALRAVGLGVSYGGADVVHDVDLQLTPGDAPVGIIGESGAGKSTIVDALAGDLKPTRGHVAFGGRTVSRLRLGDKKRFKAAVRRVQQNGLGVDMQQTVDRVLSTALKDARKAGRASGRNVADLLEDVALPPLMSERRLQTLSGGERQRIALAVALATKPDILLLDEPLTAVDPAMRGDLVRSLAEATKELGTAVLLVSHDIELVSRFCSTVHVLAEGTIVASGDLTDILANDPHPSVRALAENAPLAAQRFR